MERHGELGGISVLGALRSRGDVALRAAGMVGWGGDLKAPLQLERLCDLTWGLSLVLPTHQLPCI